jgi:LuxR family transcriptional regulator, maltose regulon positive regulatory protein
MSSERPPQCAEGDQALARGAWSEAREAYEAALRSCELPEALEGLGQAAWWLDLADLVFESRGRAYRLYLARGDFRAAARVAVWRAWDHWAFRGESVVANGFLQRARRLLEDQAECPERAWLEIREASLSLMENGDPEQAHTQATEGVRIAHATANKDLEMLGRSVQGLALVTGGAVSDGMRLLDEVNAAVISGELTDLVAIGLSCCYLIAACERVRDYDRATQWCTRLKEFCVTWGLRPLFAVCRTQYASICIWRGAWFEAEQELLSAGIELTATRPGMTGEAIVRLADLRRRQGRLVEASELLDKLPSEGAVLLVRGELAFDRGDATAAVELVLRYLRHVPTQNRTDRAAGLDLLVRASVGLGEIERAKTALGELTNISQIVDTVPLHAAAIFAAGYVALGEGEPAIARQHLEDAVDLFLKSGAPFEISRVRVHLARALEGLGRVDEALGQLQLAIDTLSQLKAEVEFASAQSIRASLAGRRTSGDNSTCVAPATSAALSRREIEVLQLVAEGLSNQAIASRLFVSDHTVHRHLANILNKLNVSMRAAAVAQAARRGLLG